MYQIDFNQPIHIHFIGIGGISMSGLAAVLLNRGFLVTGSDSKKSDLTAWLTGLGARISIPQSASNVTDDIDLVVYTAAIHPDNPEFAAAVEKGLPMMTRAELLGQLMNNYPLSVA
ncbi:MAG: Mur ligase domain-containing protein, partial [Lachnospiraceae bacterium]|nr:Mur ligase domain-containing protein [Lachnospiraceae bacterium]